MPKSGARGTLRWWPVFYLLLAGVPPLAGCGLFEIRDPVTGDGTEVCPRANPLSSDSVLVNFAQAIACKLDGQSLYSESLSESFHLVLDVIDFQELGGAVPESLTKAQDVNAQRLVVDSEPDSLFFSFGNVTPERTENTAFYLDIPYELHLIRQEGDSVIVKGKAELFLAEIGAGTWAITRWVDEREDPFISFGRWHGERFLESPRPTAGP